MKSASGTTRPDLFRRAVNFRPLNDSDMRWLWAAYQMDLWDELLPEHLERDEFRDHILDWLAQVDLDWIIETKGENGLRPIGIVLAQYRAAGRAVEPHLEWFPWATPRQKLEAVAHWIKNIRRQYKVLLFVSAENGVLWERVCKYRLVKKACKIQDYFAPNEDAIMYYTTGPF